MPAAVALSFTKNKGNYSAFIAMHLAKVAISTKGRNLETLISFENLTHLRQDKPNTLVYRWLIHFGWHYKFFSY